MRTTPSLMGSKQQMSLYFHIDICTIMIILTKLLLNYIYTYKHTQDNR